MKTRGFCKQVLPNKVDPGEIGLPVSQISDFENREGGGYQQVT